MNWLKRLLLGSAAVVALPAPAPAPPSAISDSALGRIGPAQERVTDMAMILRPAEPLPGVLPTGATLAMDSGFTDELANYANGAGLGLPCGDGFTPWMGYPLLAELSQRPEYRNMAERLAKQMTRKWVKITASSGEADDETTDDGDTEEDPRAERIEALQNGLEHFNVRALFAKMAEMDAYFGRGQLYPDFGYADDAAENSKPLQIDPRKIKKGSLKGFKAIEPIWTYPANYDARNPLASNFYRPEAWYVMGQTVHRSRLLTFVSREVPDILKPAYSFGGISLSQLAKPYVDNWLRTRQGVSDIVDAFSVMVLETDTGDLTQLSGMNALINRVEAFNRFRSNRGTFVVDKTKEAFSNVSAPIAGLDKLQAQAQEQMSAVSGIPLVILLGITPGGLNASSEGEIRTFYDWVQAQQEDFFGPHLRTVLRILQLHLFGDIDESIGFEWVPLWQLDAAQRATVRKTQADTAAVYIELGVISPVEERERLAREDESDYASLDLAQDPSEDLDAQAMAEAEAAGAAGGPGEAEGEEPEAKAA